MVFAETTFVGAVMIVEMFVIPDTGEAREAWYSHRGPVNPKSHAHAVAPEATRVPVGTLMADCRK